MLSTFVLNRGKTLLMASIALATLGNVAQAAEIKLPETTLTASLRTSMVSTSSDTGPDVMDFNLNSLSFYVNGKITDTVKFSFSSELDSSQAVSLQDAIAQFEFSPTMNIWMGRFLPPTDRANSYGAYFSNNWNFAADGTQDGYPFITFGRADGVAYWGDFADKKLKISAGLFDIPSTKAGTPDADKVMTAARVQYNFWDAEAGYYINGTYLGDKDILAVGAAVNSVDGNSTSNIDFLVEKKVAGGGAFTVEGEYIKYDKLGGYGGFFAKGDPNATPAVPPLADASSGDSWYLMSSYLFPQAVGVGKVQVLGKFGTSSLDALAGGTALEVDTTELNLNYIIKSFNAKVSLFYLDHSYSVTGYDDSSIGLGVQLMTL
ncbi:MAG: hypothetical protein U1E94_00230 [Agitococcus sp.]